ncbi:hypothetical protein [Coleofasciculus sp. FACHB-1120]|uniref:hypothetical protein n=1 Tax=Coleofasciculus sp. FACHB-1120 TaxID=2692783 RepID=UPI001689E8EF|nr:hypothetical protein [Coleofasciculus sp. FACHB-1120]MBD2741560.1 hypothetical protein [Coleofasciculus sp. FACHB-1120]
MVTVRLSITPLRSQAEVKTRLPLVSYTIATMNKDSNRSFGLWSQGGRYFFTLN